MLHTQHDSLVFSEDGIRPSHITPAYKGDYPYGEQKPKKYKSFIAGKKRTGAPKFSNKRKSSPYSVTSAEEYLSLFENVDPKVVTLFVNILPKELIKESDDFREACLSAGLSISRDINNADITNDMFPDITQEQFAFSQDLYDMVCLSHSNNDERSGASFRRRGLTLPEYIERVNTQVKAVLENSPEGFERVKPVSAAAMQSALNNFSVASTPVSSIIE